MNTAHQSPSDFISAMGLVQSSRVTALSPAQGVDSSQAKEKHRQTKASVFSFSFIALLNVFKPIQQEVALIISLFLSKICLLITCIPGELVEHRRYGVEREKEGPEREQVNKPELIPCEILYI